jgi:hypothetical protein
MLHDFECFKKFQVKNLTTLPTKWILRNSLFNFTMGLAFIFRKNTFDIKILQFCKMKQLQHTQV